MATVNAVSAISAINPVNRPCKTQKKYFATEQDAVSFEAKNRATYGGVRQYAYVCEECDSYHLSALPPDARAVTNYSKIENSRSTGDVGKWRRITEQDKQQIIGLRKRGLTFAEIAERVGTSTATVSKHLKQYEDAAKFRPATIDSLSSEEKQLEEKLQRLRQEKLRLVELNAVKVAKPADGQVSIRKGTQFMTVSSDDALEVIVKLNEVLGLST